MQRTSNYELPQWEKSDRILMEDFNGMTEKIDAAIAGRVVVGTYTGKSGTQKITLGFRPKVLMIGHDIAYATSTSPWGNTLLVADGTETDRVTFEDDGFTLPSDDQGLRPSVNRPRQGYTYVAFPR